MKSMKYVVHIQGMAGKSEKTYGIHMYTYTARHMAW